MPIYTFECISELNGCGHIFELYMSMANYSDIPPQCPNCQNNTAVKRNFQIDLPSAKIAAQTVGMLADENTRKMSVDERAALTKKNNEYRFKQGGMKTLPKGMSRMQGDIGNRIISTKQYKTDPKKNKRK